MNEITTILADDAALVRSTIAQLLALEPDISVLGEYPDGSTAMAAIATLRPDVAVLDVDMPGMDGIEVAEQVAAEQPNTRVLILSSITASGTYHAAMRAGVCGYISKTAPSYRLADAVRAVSAGGRFIDVDLADDASGSDTTPLTPRERKVLSASAKGRSTREICESLGLSSEIVGLVMTTLLVKTGGQDRREAASIASSRGWI
ncbi:MAG TPA: response regulator transcription factor [Pseudonocardiaceae bacterium]|jgi:two-component system response regulator DesR|nr:response regulator transcription factor [Pseudonocardiaceae bacterium]